MSNKMKSLAAVLAALLTVGPALALASNHGGGGISTAPSNTNPNRGKKINSPFLNIPVNFTNTSEEGIPVSFSGVLNITGFRQMQRTDGTPGLAAVGALTGTARNLQTGATETKSMFVEFPVTYAGSGAVCEILRLELGPIFLDLLGLQVIIPNEIVVIVQAVQGAGNLLGNLLCALVGILDGPGNPLQDLLQNIIDLLNGIIGGFLALG